MCLTTRCDLFASTVYICSV